MLQNIKDRIGRHPVWSALIILVLAFVIYSAIKPTPREYEYISEPISRGDVTRTVSASGKVRALNTIKVGSEISGQITKVYVDFNTPVTAGQVLAEIDPTRVRAQVERSQAQVALTQANVQQAAANISRARAELEIQERDYGRQKALADRGFVSKAGLDIAQSKLNSARNALQVAQAQAQSGNAQIRQGVADLAAAKLELSRTVIVAPASGVIINKLVEPGTTVAAQFQTPNLFEIASDTTKMQVEASVDEADIGQIREGQDVTFTVDSYPDHVFKARVRQVRQAPVETQNIVSYLVVIDVDNTDGKLLPGMTANVEIITAAKTNVLRVPTSALRFKPRAADLGDAKKQDAPKTPDKKPEPAPALYIASTDAYRPMKRKVKIGIEGDEYTEILSGVKTGDKVLVRAKSLKPKITPDADAEADDTTAS